MRPTGCTSRDGSYTSARLKEEVVETLRRGGCVNRIGEENLLGSKKDAIQALVPGLTQNDVGSACTVCSASAVDCLVHK
jgi:hypothetical protein